MHARGSCADKTGRCKVVFFHVPVLKPNYWVIDTDYENYSVVYACSRHTGTPYLYFLTREPTITEDYYNELRGKAAALLPKFNVDDLAPRDVQGDKCTYLEMENEFFMQ